MFPSGYDACDDYCAPHKPVLATLHIGALRLEIRFWVYRTIVIIGSHQNGIGNYLGPYISTLL